MQIGMVKDKGWRRPSPFFRPRGTLLLLRHSIFFALSFFYLSPLPSSPFSYSYGMVGWPGKRRRRKVAGGCQSPGGGSSGRRFRKKGREERKRRSWVCFILPSPSTPPQKSEGKRELLPRKGEGGYERKNERTNVCSERPSVQKKKRRGEFRKKYLKRTLELEVAGICFKIRRRSESGGLGGRKSGVFGSGGSQNG